MEGPAANRAHQRPMSAVRPPARAWPVTRAPLAFDGTTAGSVTDIVVTFVDLDPDEPGIGPKAGGTIRVTLPPEFTNTN